MIHVISFRRILLLVLLLAVVVGWCIFFNIASLLIFAAKIHTLSKIGEEQKKDKKQISKQQATTISEEN